MTDYESPYEDTAEVSDPHYSGCMSNLVVNGEHYPLTQERGWSGWSIGDCDGTACGAEVNTSFYILCMFSHQFYFILSSKTIFFYDF